MKTILSLILLALLFPGTVFAIDQKCFTEQQCTDMRRALGYSGDKNGFHTGTAEINKACGEVYYGPNGQEALGFCLSVGESQTTVSFGGKNRFTSMVDFIQYIFKYSISIAAVLSVLMLIIAGLQWTVSGGNSESIASAKKRIFNATIGLIIAVSTYTILYTVNPELVNLRLPQVWLLNTIEIMPQYCHEIPDEKVALALESQYVGKPDSAKHMVNFNIAYKNPENVFDADKAECGNEYYFKAGGGQTCAGSSCAHKGKDYTHTCYKDPEENPDTPSCHKGNVVGIIYNANIVDTMIAEFGWMAELPASIFGTSFLGGKWEWVDNTGWVDASPGDQADEFQLYRVCNDGYITNLENYDYELLGRGPNDKPLIDNIKKFQRYNISFKQNKLDIQPSKCDDHKGLKGYLLGFEFNSEGSVCDERHLIGKNMNQAVDVFMLPYTGQIACTEILKLENTNIFGLAINVTIQSFKELNRGNPSEDIKKYFCELSPKYFITQEEMLRGVSLNIDANGVIDAYEHIDRLTELYGNLEKINSEYCD